MTSELIKVHQLESFVRSLPAPYGDFIERRATTFDQTLPWFVEFERHLIEPSASLRILVVEDAAAKSIIAVLPMQIAPVSIVSRIKARGAIALSNYYTAYYAPIVEPGREMESARVLAREMIGSGLAQPVIDLNPISESPMLNEMEAVWSEAKFSTERYFRFGNWFHEVGGATSSDYFSRLPGQVRSTLKRKGAKFRGRDDAVIRIVTEATDVPAAMDAYEQVYRSSWKVDEPYKDFIRAIALEFAHRGWLRLGLVEIGTQPVAAQIWFVFQQTASIFKLAYDDASSDLSVGSLLTMELMRRVIDVDKVSVIDYLCGDDAYKKDWMSSRRVRIGVRAVRNMSWPGVLTALLRLSKPLRRVGDESQHSCL